MMWRSSSQILFKHLFAVLLQVAGERRLTMSASSDTRAARRARRSLCMAQVCSGVCKSVAAGLQSDADNIICWDLIDVDVDSKAESSPSSPVAKRHKLWAST